MIKSFKDPIAEKVFNCRFVKGLAPEVQRQAQKRLEMLNTAAKVSDLLIPPGNNLEALTRDRKGQHSIRINDQWRICFVFHGGDACNVEIAEYH